MSQLLSLVESHNIVLHKTAKVTTEKTALEHGKHKNEKSPDYLLVIEALFKGGGYLLSRIALQYHRRKRA